MSATVTAKESTLAGPEPTPTEATPAAAVRRDPARAGDQTVLSIRATVARADCERFVAEALHDIRVYLQEHDVAPSGPPFSVSRPSGRDLDIEAGWPTAQPLRGTSRIHAGALPGSLTRRPAGSEQPIP